MYENRSATYWQLIQKLLECSNGEEAQILNVHFDLLDPGLLETIIAVAKQFDNDGNQNEANFLTNIGLELGKFLGNDHQPTAIRKQTADILLSWGRIQYYISQFIVAFQCWQQCLIIYQGIQDQEGEANSLGRLGLAYDSLGEYEQAIYFHQKHLDISREIKDRTGEAISLGNLGNAYHSLGQYERAIDFQEQSLAIKREIYDRSGEAASLGNLGNAYHSLGQYEKAIDFHKQSLVIKQEIKDPLGKANSLGNLGNAYDSLGQYEKAISFHEKHLGISRAIKDRRGEANSLGNLGNVYNALGKYERAIDFHKQSLAIKREIKDRRGEANSLGNLGIAYHFLGEYEGAIDFVEQSLVIKREIKDRSGEAASLGNLGNAYHCLGKYERAIGFYEQSLAISREIKDRQGEANSLGNLGSAYLSLGQFERVIRFYEQSLAISREIKDRQGEAASLGNLGSAYLSLGQFERAINLYKKCLGISREIKDRFGEASSLGNLGSAYHSLGEYEQAIAFHEQYLAIGREIKNRLGEATSLNNIANAYRKLQQTEKAIKNYQDSLKIATPKTIPPLCFTAGQNLGNIALIKGDWSLALEGYEPAIKAVEQLRKGSTTDKRRQEIIKEAISVYTNAVQCYINLKQYDKAVETADRSRSRHLADLFASKDLYPQGEIPPEVEAYYRLQQQSDRLRSSDNDEMKALPATRQPTPNGDAIIERIKELEDEKQKAWLKIRSKDQVLAAQLQPAPLSFDQMQALIPDAETAILNCYTTDEHTHIFILRQNQATKLHTCEGQGLETLQNWLLNNWLKPYVENQTAWRNQMGEVLHELANRLQINQLIPQHLNGIKELIIIPHLYLHQIPFAALPLNEIPIPHSDTASDRTRGLKPLSKPTLTPTKTPPQKQPEYLSDKFRIRIVPSCQILNFCHQRGNLKPATMGIVENATGDLVFTAYECETLATMHQIDKNSRLEYEQATIGNYQNLLNEVQVLHSSHHASADLNNSLESKLHLFDGDINLGRVFTWRFSDLAEVFLSCCETNLTFTQITDDPLSIASGFLCAGARNVVSTLWAVDDLATALFCILYYQEKQDNSRSQALQKAQFKLRNFTGDELSSKYKPLLEDYFEQQKGEKQAEIVKNVRLRLDWLCRQELPFVSPYNWAGLVSQGLA
ncbi:MULTISPECIES: tetratricopeptide repeat protein [unclassified Microcoleus]|uniref:tetratricopeptide repeat protein n=1 Tax=unclassified Microcoleus TaxID=2642155 RepID=UPI002FD33553